MNTPTRTKRRRLSRLCRDVLDHAQYHVDCQVYAAEHYGEAFTAWDRLRCWLDGAATGFFNDNRWIPIEQRLLGRTAEWDAFWASPGSNAGSGHPTNER